MPIRIHRGLIALALASLIAGSCSSDGSDLEAIGSDSASLVALDLDGGPDESDPTDAGSTDTAGGETRPLDAPVNVTVQIDNSDVVLRWSDFTNPDGVIYLVARDGREVGSTAETMFREVGLDDGAYRYQVIAVADNGDWSEPFNVVAQVGAPDLFPPSDPTGVEIQVLDGKVLITWNESLDDRGVRGYLIHRDRDFYAWVTDELKFVDENVDESQTYRYRVRAQDDAANNSAPVGGIVSTGPPDVTPPSIPVIVDVNVQGVLVTIDWEDSVDDREIWGYLVHRDGIFHAWVAEESELREAVVPGSTHRYVIRAQDGAGNNSGPSETVDIAVG